MTRPIGLIGGTGWPSTALYYLMLNKLAHPGTVRILLTSLSFSEVLSLASKGDFQAIREMYRREAQRLEAAGAGCLALCAATAHMAYDEVAAAVEIPVLHIASPLRGADSPLSDCRRVGLLGTLQTLEAGHFTAPIHDAGADVVIPSGDLASLVDAAIKGPISSGQLIDEAVAPIAAAIADLVSQGADAIMLGCTELPLIVEQLTCPVRMVDVVELHCQALLQQAPATLGSGFATSR